MTEPDDTVRCDVNWTVITPGGAGTGSPSGELHRIRAAAGRQAHA